MTLPVLPSRRLCALALAAVLAACGGGGDDDSPSMVGAMGLQRSAPAPAAGGPTPAP